MIRCDRDDSQAAVKSSRRLLIYVSDCDYLRSRHRSPTLNPYSRLNVSHSTSQSASASLQLYPHPLPTTTHMQQVREMRHRALPR